MTTAEELRARIARLDPERRKQLAARVAYEQEVRRTLWLCKNILCLGNPHHSAPARHARKNQRLPFKDGDGKIGALWMAGRGYGKTRIGAEGTRSMVDSGRYGRVALVGRTAADVRDTMLQGDAGLLQCWPKWQRPVYLPSKRLVEFYNGAAAFCYSSEEPDLLRGPAHHLAWADEVSTFRELDAVMANLLLGLRLGQQPRAILTGTPRPTKAMRKLVANDKITIIRGTTYENLVNLAPTFRDTVVDLYEGTRVGRQELDGELLLDVEGALLNYDQFEYDGFRPDVLPELTRVVVAVDPAVSAGTNSDYTGIVVVALGVDGRAYVLHAQAIKDSPAKAMGRVVELYHQFNASFVVAEVNNGGDYIKTAIYQLDDAVPVTTVHASVGKMARAEPVAMLYEQHRISHVGHPSLFAQLETEWTSWVPGDKDSPDTMDACVWALTYLLLGGKTRRVLPARPVKA